MVDQSPNRQIVVRITKPKPLSERQRDYDYRWDRIIGALSALLLLIGLLGYGLYSWLTPSSPPPSVALEKPQGPDEILVGATQEWEGEAAGAMPAHSEPIPSSGAETQPMGTELLSSQTEPFGAESNSVRSPAQSELLSKGPSQKAANEAAEVDPHGLVEATTLPAEIAEPMPMQSGGEEGSAERARAQMPVSEEPGDMEVRVTEQVPPSRPRPASSSVGDAPNRPVALGKETVPETESGEQAAGAFGLEEDSDHSHLRPRDTTISSPAVKRFLLAQSVEGNEPKGGLGDISMSAKGFAAVASFSEVIGLEGQVLQYRWLHEGKEVLQIRVPVGAERWRSHSTKRIYKRMKGRWRAELRDSAGALLASADFVF